MSGPCTRDEVTSENAETPYKTANGNLPVGEVVQGENILQSSVGKIDVGVREGSAAWLDVSSKHGGVRNNLTDGEPQAASAAVVSIRVKTSFGTVTIGRAPTLNPAN